MTRPFTAPRMLALAMLLLALPTAARAVPPPNDDCAAATVVTTLPFGETVNLGEATAGPGDPPPACAAATFNSVWYALTPSAPTTIALFPYDGLGGLAVTAVYTGSCGSLTPVSCNTSPVPLAAGTTYYVEFATTFSIGPPLDQLFSITREPTCGDCVTDPGEDCDDCNGIDGDACSNLCVAPPCGNGDPDPGEECDDGNGDAGDGCEACVVVPPANDDCAAPMALTPLAATGIVETAVTTSIEATSDGGDPLLCSGDAGTHTVWFEYTSPVNGRIIFDLTPQPGAQTLAVWTGACGALADVACHESLPSDYAAVTFDVESGVTYVLEAASATGHAPVIVEYALAAVCGDGVPALGFGEDCDDGNVVDGDGCDSDCRYHCGNGVLEGSEECDDANAVDGDACTNTCTDAACGDGVVHVGAEQCDDGNANPADGCNACVINPEPHDACSAATVVPPSGALGDTFYPDGATNNPSDPPHSCTGGNQDHATVWYTWTATFTGLISTAALTQASAGPVVSIYTGGCAAPVEQACGLVGVPGFPVAVGETYLIEVSLQNPAPNLFVLFTFGPTPFCGDGSQNQISEECDDGNGIDGDDCTNACTIAECGDGVTHFENEDCDDGNATPGDGCDACVAVCGDGFQVGHEHCDDGNTMDGDGCESNCRFPCPYDLCNCLGAAGSFAVVGGKSTQIKTGRISEGGGEPEAVENEIDGSVCALTAKVTGKFATEIIGGDFAVAAPAKTGVQFNGYTIDGMDEPGGYIGGDLVTNGSLIKGLTEAAVDGVVSTDGSHPLAAQCEEALADVKAASAVLAALPPTLTLGDLVVENGDTHTIIAGPGLQVIAVNSIRVISGEDDDNLPIPSELEIAFGPGTEIVIVNVADELTIDEDSSIVVTGFEDSVILNLHSAKPKLKLKLGASVMAPLLMPAKTAKIPTSAYLANLYATGKLQLGGAYVEDVLHCDD